MMHARASTMIWRRGGGGGGRLVVNLSCKLELGSYEACAVFLVITSLVLKLIP